MNGALKLANFLAVALGFVLALPGLLLLLAAGQIQLALDDRARAAREHQLDLEV